MAVRRGRVLPGPLGLTPPFPFVGRSSELRTLRSLLPIAAGPEGRVALLGGEAGSGKTRLVREFAHEQAARGALVLYGASDEIIGMPYQPFVESLDFLVRMFDAQTLRQLLGTGGAELSRLLPDLPLRLGGTVRAPVMADPDTERHRLHTAVAELLAGMSRRRPMLFVLDDVHWADAPSLHLLRYLARTRADARMLLLATFRDREADFRPGFSDALADLSRIEGVARFRLSGLSSEDVTEFVRRSAGADEGTDVTTLARAIGELTGGNPFLLCELWRALVDTGAVEIAEGRVRLARPVADLGSPESVRNVVTHRLALLAPATAATLEVAAVVGAQFELDVLAAAASLDEAALAAGLDEAVRSGMIEEVPGPRLAHRFTHELVRRALYDRLTGLRRADLHLRVGEALECSHAADPGRVLSELAHHFTVAAPLGGQQRAIAYNLRAGAAAMASLAFEEAAARLSWALELGIVDERQRAQVQLQLGTAHRKAGQTLEAMAAFRSAAAVARSNGDAKTLARAAIGFEETCWRPGIADEGAVELLDEAVSVVEEGDSSLKALVLASLSRALVYVQERERAAAVCAQAVEMARRVGDRSALASVLATAYWAQGTIPRDDVLAMLNEARELGEELGDAEIVALASAWTTVTLVGLCDLAAAARELEALRRVAQRTRQPFMMQVAEQFGSALALGDGRLADAEVMAERAWEWSRQMHGRTSSATHGLQMFGIRREQGRLPELQAVVELLATKEKPAAWRPGLIALLAELGMDKAREELERLRADGLASIPRDSLWMASLVYLTDACSALDDGEMARVLYPELKPLGGANLQIGQLVVCYGATDRYLGMLAAAKGEWDAAEAHFRYALHLNRRMGAHTWTAHTAYQYGRMLLRRNHWGDRARAAELLAEGARLSERFELVAVGGKIRALGAIGPVSAVYPSGLSAREVEVLRLVARGRTNREIGGELFISEHTAANHVRTILRKTACKNRTDAASYAYRHGLIESDRR
ncbi:MAG TPA: AAA family ATPase [Actinomycetes bacterium]|nr:AAA family ATPase [Actinomycetes bacterium]